MGQLKFCDPHQQQLGIYHEAHELSMMITYDGETFEIDTADICPLCFSVFHPMIDYAKGNGPWPIPSVEYSSPVEAALDAPLPVVPALPAPASVEAEPEAEPVPEVPASLIVQAEPEPGPEPEPEVEPAPKSVPPQRPPSDSKIREAEKHFPGEYLVYCLHKRCIHNGEPISVLPIKYRQDHAHSHKIQYADELEWGILPPPEGKEPLEACPVCRYPLAPSPQGRSAHYRTRHPAVSPSLSSS